MNTKGKFALLGLLMLAVGMLYAIVQSVIAMSGHPRTLFGPPVGAGAMETGGANAIGELLAGHAGNKPHLDAEAAREAQRALEKKPAELPAEPKLVQPESLPQGFILVVEDSAQMASQSSPIYLAGSFNNWNPGDKDWKLTPGSDLKWRFDVAQPESWKKGEGSPLEFKFTRGSWELEELNADLSAPKNRNFPKVDASKLKPGEKPVITMVVAKWGDQRPSVKERQAADPYAPISVQGTLKRLQVLGGGGGAEGADRDCLVWLPAGYDAPENATRVYPVLYLHDAQNLFAKPATAPAEWQVDETATRLIASGACEPFVVVGLPHAGAARLSEYLNVPAIPSVTPGGDKYVEWLVAEVLPRVQHAFRVESRPERVAIGGSSLGATIALRAATIHPEAFGMVLLESPPLRTGSAVAWDQWTTSIATWPKRAYVGIGAAETGDKSDKAAVNQAYVDAAKALDSRMTLAGVEQVFVVGEHAEHTEAAWAARLPKALQFLFPKR